MSGTLLVVGDVITDIVARHDAPLAAGTDTAAEIRTLPGGAGANVACWAAYSSCSDVALLGRVGADSVAWHEEALTRAGVRPLLAVDPEAATGTVISLVDTGAGAERTFLTDSGASLRLSPPTGPRTCWTGSRGCICPGICSSPPRGALWSRRRCARHARVGCR